MDVIEELVAGKDNIEEQIIEILRFRGFLIDDNSGGYIVSDNSCLPDDEEYLEMLLEENHLGTVRDGRIVLDKNGNVDGLVQALEKSGRIGGEAYLPIEYDWERFSGNTYGLKVPVKKLELYIARYIKAISACGVSTYCSCDGNHPGSDGLKIDYCGIGDGVWHNYLFDNLLADRFGLARNESGHTILFSKSRKKITYLAINQAAAYLYDNRIKIREIKKNALAGKTCSYFRQTSEDVIEKDFLANAGRLLGESGLI